MPASAGKTLAFVPTMGNLHEGHLDLVRKARGLCDVVVVSIFVNPMQFGPNEDLDSYPRTMAADKEKLFAEGVQILYAPPPPRKSTPRDWMPRPRCRCPTWRDTLCAANRPGHFTGVTTVVSKLFNIVQPDVAVFGEKDFQQLSIVRKMVTDLCMPIEIIGVRTSAGRGRPRAQLAQRLPDADTAGKIAPRLNELLVECREAIACGFDNFRELEIHAQLKLIQAGFEPDYFEIRDARTLREVTEHTEEVAILAAAKLGKPRLIDNVRLSLNPVSDWGMLSVR